MSELRPGAMPELDSVQTTVGSFAVQDDLDRRWNIRVVYATKEGAPCHITLHGDCEHRAGVVGNHDPLAGTKLVFGMFNVAVAQGANGLSLLQEMMGHQAGFSEVYPLRYPWDALSFRSTSKPEPLVSLVARYVAWKCRPCP